MSEQKTDLQKGKFYWIRIKQYNDGSQNAIRIADKWSIAQWDGESFEEMNEMYRVEDVEEIGKCIPTNEEATEFMPREKYDAVVEVLKELIEIAESHTILKFAILSGTFYPELESRARKMKSAIERAKSLLP